MNQLDRVCCLCLLLQAAGGSVEGRERVDLLAYLCQMGGTDLGHSFEYQMYMIYSPSLTYDIAAARDWGAIRTEGSSDPILQSYRLLWCPYSKPDKPEGLYLVEKLKDASTPVLDVLATIVYLHRRRYGGELLTVLSKNKREQRRYFPEALKLAQELFKITMPTAI